MSTPAASTTAANSNTASVNPENPFASVKDAAPVNNARVGRAKSIKEVNSRYPIEAEGYEVFREIGHGAFAVVYHARVIATNEPVAIKVLDLERHNLDTAEIWKEISIMRSMQHKNVAEIHCSFVVEADLWMVMPFYAAGSCSAIIKDLYPTGFKDEALVATILKGLLTGLAYFHKHDRMHRDIKAGNILISAEGEVKLADFGVAGTLIDEGDRKQGQTFTGTPCWMAPEVMEQSASGYDSKSDIWSLGITALELAYGMAPYATSHPMKVMLMILQNEPPTAKLFNDNTYSFSPAYHNFVKKCLKKNPSKRLTAKALLEHPFFKKAKDESYIVTKVLDVLKPAPDLSTLEPLKLNVEKKKKEEQGDESEKRKVVSVPSFIFTQEMLDNMKKAAEVNAEHVANEDILYNSSGPSQSPPPSEAKEEVKPKPVKVFEKVGRFETFDTDGDDAEPAPKTLLPITTPAAKPNAEPAKQIGRFSVVDTTGDESAPVTLMPSLAEE